MGLSIARIAFVGISVVVVAATAFRISEAPNRAKARLETARSVCAQNGGEWIKVDRDEICRVTERPRPS